MHCHGPLSGAWLLVVARTDTFGLSPARVPAQELMVRRPLAAEPIHSLQDAGGDWTQNSALGGWLGEGLLG